MLPVARRLPALVALFSVLTLFSGCGQDDTQVSVSPQTISTDKVSTTEPLHSSDSAETAPAELYDGIPLTVSEISQQTYDDGNTVGIRFSVPLNRDQPLQSFLHVSGQQSAWILSADGLSLFMLDGEPGKTYSVSVSSGLTAINGARLSKGLTADVTLSEAPPSAGFASDGHYLTTDLSVGLPVTVLNVSEVNVSFFRVRGDDEALRQMLLWTSGSTRESVYNLDDLGAFSDFVYEGRIGLTSDRNKRRTVNLPLKDIPGLSEKSVYLAVMEIPGVFSTELSATWFSVSDIGVHVRKYQDQLGIYTRDLNTGLAKSDVSLTLMRGYRSEQADISRADSGRHGYVAVTHDIHYNSVLIARKDDSVTLMRLYGPDLDLSDFDSGSRHYREHELYLYSPRDLYRGGETVYINALLRNDDGAVDGTLLLKSRLKRADGTVSDWQVWKPQMPGFYATEFTLPQDASTGDWRLQVQEPSGKQHSYAFKVEDFMPERLKLDWNPQQLSNVFRADKPVTVALQGSYLYGAPASGNKFDATLTLRPSQNPFPDTWPEFVFGDQRNRDWAQTPDDVEGVLDDEGNLTVTAPNTWAETKIPLTLRFSGSLYESGGRPVVRSHSVAIVPDGAMPAVRPLFKDSVDASSLARFELINTSADGSLTGATELQVSLTNITEDWDWRYSPADGWHVERRIRNLRELTMPVTTVAGQVSQLSVPVQWGEYMLEVLNPASGLSSRFYFSAGEAWYWRAQRDSARPDKVELAWDKAAYAGGDTARLKVTPPGAGRSLILVEDDGLLFSTEADIPAEGGWVDIPVNSQWCRHDIYVSVIHLQPSDTTARITPTRSLGLIHLPLNREPRHLQIDIETAEKWRPETRQTINLSVRDGNGTDVSKAWVTLAAVDVGVLSISRFRTPDAFDFFFGQRRFQVGASDMYADLIDLNDNRTGMIRFGGDADLSRGGDLARSEVQIISLYSGLVDVVDGKASVPVDMPDFNGRVRLMALAFNDTMTGSADKEVTVAAPVVTQLSLPRFIAAGDQSMAALDVTNLTGADATLAIRLSVSGAAKNIEVVDTPLLKDKQRITLTLPLEATQSGRAVIRAEVRNGDELLVQREWGLQSRYAYPALTYTGFGVLSDNEKLVLDGSKLASWLPDTRVVSAVLSNTINLDAERRMEALLTYPYGCLEQTISSSYPWLYASDELIAQRGATRATSIASGIDRIATRQKSNGGFGLWTRDDEDEQHWLAAYAMQFLTDVREAGYPVDDTMLRSGLQRLREYTLNRAKLHELWAHDPSLYRFTYQAYAHYVLARHNMASLTDIRAAAAHPPEAAGALALLHLSLAAAMQGDQRLADELYATSLKADAGRRTYMSDYGSPLRDTALQAYLLWKHNTDAERAARLTRSLQGMLRQRTYLSTQEKLALVQLAGEQAKHESGRWLATLELGGEATPMQGSGAVRHVLRTPALADGLTVENNSDKTLYVDLSYQGYGTEAPEEQKTGGVSVERLYWTTKGEQILPKDGNITLTTGDMMLISLTVYSNTYRPDLLVEDLLPAGLEIENQNLADSTRLKDLVIDGEPASSWLRSSGLVHEEFRDDRYVAALRGGSRYSSDQPSRLFYLVRAVTPGTYKVPNPLLEDMYDPDVRAVGRTPASLTVLPR